MDEQPTPRGGKGRWRPEPFQTPRAKRWSIGSGIAAVLGMLLLCGGSAVGVVLLAVAFVAYRGARRIDDRQHPFPPLIRKATAWRPKSRREWALAGGGVLVGLSLMSGGGGEPATEISEPTEVVAATEEPAPTEAMPTRTRPPTSTRRPTREPATATVELPTATAVPPSPVPPTVAPTVAPPPSAAPIVEQAIPPPAPQPALQVPAGPPSGFPLSDDVNCSDFSRQADAQAWWNYWRAQGAVNPGRLDGSDHDGFVCESLP